MATWIVGKPQSHSPHCGPQPTDQQQSQRQKAKGKRKGRRSHNDRDWDWLLGLSPRPDGSLTRVGVHI
jgi:hypothetical protein